MIDLAKKRAENQARLMGVKKSDSGVAMITKEEIAADPEKAWHIIALATKKEMVDSDKLTAKGKVRRVQGKDLAYPDLISSVDVGHTAAKSKKVGNKSRSNTETMRYMYSVRNKMISFYESDTTEDFLEYFSSVIEILDAYATEVVSLAIDADPDLLSKVYEIDVREAEAVLSNLEKARDAREG